MKILVPIKRVVDYNVRVRVRTDGSGLELNNVKMSMNPFDEIALEEAVRLKEKGVATEVIAISIGVPQAKDTLRTALAMGADRAILVHATDDVCQDIEPLSVARILEKIIKSEAPQLVIAGKQAIDNDMNATGQMLAAALGWGQATYASAIEVQNNTVLVTREIDGGLQTLCLKLPAVVTTDLRLNQPRYVALPAIMKAKKKTIDEISIKTLGIDITPRLSILSTAEPPKRQAGIKVKSVDELVSKLKNEAGVL
nr:electron transfer flavoprotein subunit beta/FixA family protein [uncultured Acetobacter sp.]